MLGSIAANALLRTHHGVGAPLLQPRYRFYGSLLLALTYLGWLETLDRPRLARRFARAALPVALAFSLLSFALYRGAVIDFSERLERGFEHWWTTGDGGLSHPEFRKASVILLAALDAGHLRPPPGWAERLGSDPLPVTPPPAGRSVAMGVDAVAQDDQVLLLSGWADVADGARGQEVEVVLNSRTGEFGQEGRYWRPISQPTSVYVGKESCPFPPRAADTAVVTSSSVSAKEFSPTP